MRIDLHVHTSPLSPDSSMSADEAIEAAREIGLDGICFTEHDRAWGAADIHALRAKHDFPVFRGVEVMLRGGIEVLVFGLDRDFTSLLELAELRKMVAAANGFMVCAHPFRGLPEHTLADSTAAIETVLGRMDIGCIDAVEGLNGRNKDKHNQAALEMAAAHGLKTTGGSDAHAASEVGTCVTVFEREVRTGGDLLRELAAGRFTSARFRARQAWAWQDSTRTIQRWWL